MNDKRTRATSLLKPLTAKQERFVAEYLVDLNGTQAAIRAGYAPKTATKIASENLTKPDLRSAIAAAKAAQVKRLNLKADEVLLELHRIASSDIRQIFDAQGNLKAVKDLPDDVAAALSSVDVIRRNCTSGDGQSDTIHKLRFWDKLRALELLAKHFRLLEHDDTKPPVEPQKLVLLIQNAPHDLTP